MVEYKRHTTKDEINVPIALSAFRDKSPHSKVEQLFIVASAF